MTKFAKYTAEEALALIPADASGSDCYAEPFAHGSMSIGMYAPRGVDDQQPHSKDELYFIHSGSAVFIHNDTEYKVNAGDSLFVAAMEEHRFVNQSEDFTAWVVFWGPDGGE